MSRRKTYSLKTRKSKVRLEDFARPPGPVGDRKFSGFIQNLPNLLLAKDFREFIKRIGEARSQEGLILWGMGAHVIKAGLSPVIIDLARRGWVHGIALNGAGLVHDFEVARVGRTSEDVEEALGRGEFGFARETGEEINRAINEGVERGLGLGEAVAEYIAEDRQLKIKGQRSKVKGKNPENRQSSIVNRKSDKFPFRKYSILAAAYELGIPVTVHVAIGTDITHLHQDCDGKALGEGSLRDFHRFAHLVSRMEGGAYLNLGSAVILPEVFLKALAYGKNRKGKNFLVRKGITTATFDFQKQYRELVNVTQRPARISGPRSRGYYFLGAHEIMIPMLAWALP
jgi:deoxyhypusine synthase